MKRLHILAINIVGLLLLGTLLHLATYGVKAQESPRMQEITSSLDATGTAVFVLDELQ